MSRKQAFTLVELLVVIAIIALLIAILLPVLGKAKEQSQGVVCQSNQRQLAAAFLLFAQDNKGQLPGNFFDRGNPILARTDWLLGNSDGNWIFGPQTGTIFPYLARKLDVYRCPSFLEGIPGTGRSSNGRFDYAAYLCFTGAKVTRIKPMSRFIYSTGRIENVPTPLLCDEDPAFGINTANREGGHSNTDKMDHRHNGGGYYASIDSSVHWFNEPRTQDSWSWESPAGPRWISLGNFQDPANGQLITWGWWNSQ